MIAVRPILAPIIHHLTSEIICQNLVYIAIPTSNIYSKALHKGKNPQQMFSLETSNNSTLPTLNMYSLVSDLIFERFSSFLNI